MEPVRVTFTPTPEDYTRTLLHRLMLNIEPTYVVIATVVLVMGACIVSALSLYAYSLFYISRSTVTLGCMTPGLCVIIYTVLMMSYVAFRGTSTALAIQAHPHLFPETTYEFSPDYIRTSHQLAEAQGTWKGFTKTVESKSHYYLISIMGPFYFVPIPKHAFESPAHEAAFRAMVEAHLGTIKK